MLKVITDNFNEIRSTVTFISQFQNGNSLCQLQNNPNTQAVCPKADIKHISYFAANKVFKPLLQAQRVGLG